MDRSGFSPERQYQLEQILSVGSTAWPSLALSRSVLSDYLAERFGDDRDVPGDVFADLYLACACATGVPGAIGAFTEAYLSRLDAQTRSFDPSPDFADDVCQKLAETLFVSKAGAAPKIAQYSGEGPLERWVAISVKRIALRLSTQRRLERPAENDFLAREICNVDDCEALLAKAELKAAFKVAFAQALRSLTPRQRTILRMKAVRGVSMDVIATMHQVSQPTISRWFEQTRRDLANETRRLMAESLRLSSTELDSAFRISSGKSELSLFRLLRDGSASAP